MDYGYQVPGVDFLAANTEAFLADEPGLGKTVQAIRAAEKINARRILVLCPLTGVNYWQREFVNWWSGENHPEVTVVPYHVLSEKGHPTRTKLASLPKAHFDLMICDEAHWLKTPESIRTETTYKRLVHKAKRVWLLSGTPAPNHAGELWSHLYHLRPDLITEPGAKRPLPQDQFEDRYCRVEHDPKFNARRIRGSRNIPELRARVAPFILRRRKSEVLPDLPPMIFDTYPLHRPSGYALPASVVPADDAFRAMAEHLDVDAEILGEMQHQEKPFAALRHEIGLIKAPLALDHIEDELGSPGKVVVFAWHRDVLQLLFVGLTDRGFAPVLVDGSTPLKERDEAVDLFQNPDSICRVFIGQIAACGELITLTEGRAVIFVESSWNPMQNAQAAARIHRIGQTRGTIGRFLVLPNTSDVYQQGVLARKARDFASLFD